MAEFRSSGVVTAVLSKGGHLFQARFPPTWLRLRMIGHEPMELFGLTRKMGDPDPELLCNGLRSKGVPEEEIAYLTVLVRERTKRGRPPKNKGRLLVRNWIVLLEVLGWLWRGKNRTEACELIAPFHGLQPDTLNRTVLPPLSGFEKIQPALYELLELD